MGQLEQRNHELIMIGEAGELLQACRTFDEAVTVIARLTPDLFPGLRGALYLYRSSRNVLQKAFSLRDDSDAAIIEPQSCWALRRGRLYTSEALGLTCEHSVDPSFNTLCAPLIAYGENLGILHLLSPTESLGDTRVRLASAFAETIAVALSNINPTGTSARRGERRAMRLRGKGNWLRII